MVKEVEDLSSIMSRMRREELQELEEEERRSLLGVFSTVSVHVKVQAHLPNRVNEFTHASTIYLFYIYQYLNET